MLAGDEVVDKGQLEIRGKTITFPHVPSGDGL
jgi:hypothetical protein